MDTWYWQCVLFQKQERANKATALVLGDSAGRLSTPEPETGMIKQYRGKWRKEENDLCDQEEEEVEDVQLITIAPC